jgi:DNA-binding NarL/FixJ family response regulator
LNVADTRFDPLETVTIALIAEGWARETIRRSLGTRITVRAFASITDLLSVSGWEPDAVVLEVKETVSSMTGLIEALVERRAGTPVVVTCDTIQKWDVRAALSAGAAGVVTKATLLSALEPCLYAVGAGQLCVPLANSGQVEPPALSMREKQILGLVVMGYMNSEIAQRLFVAESTVKSHLSSAFGKLGVHSRNEAASLILDGKRGLGMGILALGGEPLEPARETVA